MGGAPFNVAWHLQGFGLQPLFITRLGQDQYGEHFTKAMQAWGMTLAAVQYDAEQPTGICRVDFGPNGEPLFHTESSGPFDFIDLEAALKAMPNGSFFYHGCFAARRPSGEAVLTQLIQRRAGERFIDVNLRTDTTPELVRRLVRGADFAKLNDEEFGVIYGAQVTTAAELSGADARRLAARYENRLVFVTRGAHGAVLLRGDAAEAPLSTGAGDAKPFADSVGAGDAFCAAMIYGLFSGWSEDLLISRAASFASAICKQRGAICSDRAFYDAWIALWKSPTLG